MSVKEIEREVQGLSISSLNVPQSDSSRTRRHKLNKKEKDIYFAVDDEEDGKVWYLIKNKDAAETTSKVEKKLSPIFNSHPSCRIGTSFEALGPHIFAIGGVEYGQWNHRFPYVYSIDTRFPQEGWKPRAPLLKPRKNPYVVVIDDLIYAFGGSDDPLAPWAEVCDISRDKWSRLYMDPPHGLSCLPNFFRSHAVVSAGNWPKILLCCGPAHKLIYCDLRARQCYLIDSNLNKRLDVAAQVGNNIYSVYDQVYCCYLAHIKTLISQRVNGFRNCNKPVPVIEYEQTLNTIEFRSQVDGFENFESAIPPIDKYDCMQPTALVHIGNGDLCLLWSEKPDHYKKALLIHCTKFTVSEKHHTDTSDDCSLVAHVKSYNVYEVEGIALSNCVAVVSRPHKKNIKKSKKKVMIQPEGTNPTLNSKRGISLGF